MPSETMPQPLPDPLPKKLNAGCGYDRREGYLNVDLHGIHKPDLIADVTHLPMLPSSCFEEVLAQDVLEHFERAKTTPALAELARLLAPQGILHVRVPSLFGMFELLAAPERRGHPGRGSRAPDIVHLIYGTRAYTGDNHLAGFTAAIPDEHLRRTGLQVSAASIHHGWLFDVRARKCVHPADDGEFLHWAYFTILGRPADPGVLAAHRERFRAGLRRAMKSRPRCATARKRVSSRGIRPISCPTQIG